MKRDKKVIEYQNKTIRLPEEIWNLISEDADRCCRSDAKQIEAVFTVYFRLNDVELKDVDRVRQIVSPTLDYSAISTPIRKPDRMPPEDVVGIARKKRK